MCVCMHVCVFVRVFYKAQLTSAFYWSSVWESGRQQAGVDGQWENQAWRSRKSTNSGSVAASWARSWATVVSVLGACGGQEVAVLVVAIQVSVVVVAAVLYNNDPVCLHVW